MGTIAITTDRDDIRTTPLENPRQAGEGNGSTGDGPNSARSSRAMVISCGKGAMVFISGTASITGSRTRHPDDAVRQTEETLDNIAALIGEENLARSGLPGLGSTLASLALARVYIKQPADFPAVRRVPPPAGHGADDLHDRRHPPEGTLGRDRRRSVLAVGGGNRRGIALRSHIAADIIACRSARQVPSRCRACRHLGPNADPRSADLQDLELGALGHDLAVLARHADFNVFSRDDLIARLVGGGRGQVGSGRCRNRRWAPPGDAECRARLSAVAAASGDVLIRVAGGLFQGLRRFLGQGSEAA